jgi:hypothetical protein
MLRRRPIAVALALAVAMLVALAPTIGLAQQPAVLDHFRLIPRLSVLHETGGFGGFNNRYRLTGEFDLAHDAGWAGDASFENAEVWGSKISPFPTPAVVEDIDLLLNLEGLEGAKLPVAAPFDAYRFRGKIRDGSTIDLFAAHIGPWLGLRGFTTPPPNVNDYFEYELRAVARQRPVADFNDDGVVDAADLAAWASGQRPSIASAPVHGGDFLAWQRQLGEAPPDFEAVLSTLIAAANPSLAAVPEPNAAVLALGASLVAAVRRRHR